MKTVAWALLSVAVGLLVGMMLLVLLNVVPEALRGLR